MRELDVDVVAPVLDVAHGEQREAGALLVLPEGLGEAVFIGCCSATSCAW